MQAQRRDIGVDDDGDPSTPSNDDDGDGLIDNADFPSQGNAFNFIEEVWAGIRRSGSGDDAVSDDTTPSSCAVPLTTVPTISLCALEHDAIAFANAYKTQFP